MFFLTYIYYKVVAVVLRTLLTRGRRRLSFDHVDQIRSRDAGRTIKAHVYRPKKSARTPSPVLINFHGSGFILPMHGTDDEFCRQVSEETEYTVLDVQYRLAPEHPFPAAIHDVEDVVKSVLDRPKDFDLSRVAISGFSAGGNLALAGSSSLFPRGTFTSLLAFYPVTNLSVDPGSKASPDPAGRPIPAVAGRFFNRCYIPSTVDARDPRISPTFAQVDRFPDRLFVVTGSGDSLAGEAEELAGRVAKLPGREVVCQRMQGCNHAWDKNARADTIQGDAKDKAYAMAIAMLQRS